MQPLGSAHAIWRLLPKLSANLTNRWDLAQSLRILAPPNAWDAG
jgi:hypothetical protein